MLNQDISTIMTVCESLQSESQKAFRRSVAYYWLLQHVSIWAGLFVLLINRQGGYVYKPLVEGRKRNGEGLRIQELQMLVDKGRRWTASTVIADVLLNTFGWINRSLHVRLAVNTFVRQVDIYILALPVGS